MEINPLHLARMSAINEIVSRSITRDIWNISKQCTLHLLAHSIPDVQDFIKVINSALLSSSHDGANCHYSSSCCSQAFQLSF